MDRRSFIKAGVAGVGLAAGATRSARADVANLVLPSLGVETHRPRTPVEHIVVVMMENRSVNHYQGWYGAENDNFDGIQTAAYLDDSGTPIPTDLWGRDGRGNYHGRTYADPGHSWKQGRVERNEGACDGWMKSGSGNDEFALSYYNAVDLPVWSQLTRGWQAYDRWFCALLGPTQPNRRYMHSAQSGGRMNNALAPELVAEDPAKYQNYALGFDWPTIWTLLENKGITCAYYFSNIPEILEWGPRHIRHARHVSEYYAAAEAGQLPQVSFVDPWFIQPDGISNDDHPHADLRLGQAFLSDVVDAFVTSPQYRRGAMVVTYDEWGGFWDHVNPPSVRDERAAEGFGQLGFRIPSTIISPWTKTEDGKTGKVDHTTYEHVSTLKFIAENWGLGYLNERHQYTNSIEHAFKKFKRYSPDAAFTPYEAPADLVLAPHTGEAVAASDLYRLLESGWMEGVVRTDWRFEDSFKQSLSLSRR